MTMGLACDRDGYDLRKTPCPRCGSRGCDWNCPGKILESVRVRRAERTPNRLKGTTINEEGDAV